MKLALEGGFPIAGADVVIEDEKGNGLRVTASDALELMDLLMQNAKILEQVRDDEKGEKQGKRGKR